MPSARGRIYIIAGTNGAGKSSVVGALLREEGSDYFNPDAAARRIREVAPEMDSTAANSLAWQEGVARLRTAVRDGTDFVLETTLGGETITEILESAARSGVEIYLWYVGLDSAERHIERVAARVRGGGHEISEDTIRRRFDASRLNLIRLARHLTELSVFDNSTEADPAVGDSARPTLVVHAVRGRIVAPRNLRATPEWAKPIVAALLKSKR